MIKFFRGAVLALILVPSEAKAQDFDVGMTAYNTNGPFN
jgi:hypothetical protein